MGRVGGEVDKDEVGDCCCVRIDADTTEGPRSLVECLIPSITAELVSWGLSVDEGSWLFGENGCCSSSELSR
jgi:hypothetical protein